MADHANAARRGGEREEAEGSQAGAEARGVEGEGGRDIEEDHVGLDVVGIEFEPGDVGEALGETLGVGVIVGEPFAVVIEGVEGGGGEDAALAHRATEHFAEASDAGDGPSIARNGGPGGAAQALGEAGGDGVEVLCVVAGLEARGDAGVPEAGAVEVEFEIVLSRGAGDAFDLLDGPDGAAAAVVGVFDDEELAVWSVDGVGADGKVDVVGVEEPVLAGEGADHDAREGGGAAGLVMDDVAVGVGDDFVARLGLGADGGLVGHGAGGDEAGGFFAEESGKLFLESQDGGIIAEDIVADVGVGHDLAHGCGGAGDGVAAKVDDGHG